MFCLPKTAWPPTSYSDEVISSKLEMRCLSKTISFQTSELLFDSKKEMVVLYNVHGNHLEFN